jgi:hypothetical protein
VAAVAEQPASNLHRGEEGQERARRRQVFGPDPQAAAGSVEDDALAADHVGRDHAEPGPAVVQPVEVEQLRQPLAHRPEVVEGGRRAHSSADRQPRPEQAGPAEKQGCKAAASL